MGKPPDIPPLPFLSLVWACALLASGLFAHDRETWAMEVAPVLIAWPVLLLQRHHWRLTHLALGLIGFHGLVLMLGGAYTYAQVPVGFWLRDWLGLARNPYDRFGHLVQGFVPAIVFREMLIRGAGIARGKLLSALVLACCLAVSASYELIEFAAAQLLGQEADAFLGSQGDPWDTQWDMLCAVIGATASLLLLSRLHDRQIARLQQDP